MGSAFSRAWIDAPRSRPLAIAHRGASAYTFDNTLRAFRIAHDLGAELWEVDVHLSRDQVVVACHDADLLSVCGDPRPVSELDYQEIARLSEAAGRRIPAFSEIVTLADSLGTGIYVDAKVQPAARGAIEVLRQANFERAIIGTSDPRFCAALKADECPYAVSLLVGLGADAFALADAARPDLLHPCWERAGDRPDRLLDTRFFEEVQARGLPVVTWHEERPDVAKALCDLPVFAICSDTPELLKPYRDCHPAAPEIVCHRGLRSLAPENTLASVRAAFSAGFDRAEVDVHQIADGSFVVLHDATLDRTTNLSGSVADCDRDALKGADAGGRRDRFFTGEPVPMLGDVLSLAREWGGKLYVELKVGDPLRLAEEVLAGLPVEQVFFWSFKADYCRAIRKAFPKAQMMARAEDYPSLVACRADYDPQVIEFNGSNATAEALAQVHAFGVKSMIAYMGGDRDKMQEILDLRPDILNLDEPLLARDLLTCDFLACHRPDRERLAVEQPALS